MIDIVKVLITSIKEVYPNLPTGMACNKAFEDKIINIKEHMMIDMYLKAQGFKFY